MVVSSKSESYSVGSRVYEKFEHDFADIRDSLDINTRRSTNGPLKTHLSYVRNAPTILHSISSPGKERLFRIPAHGRVEWGHEFDVALVDECRMMGRLEEMRDGGNGEGERRLGEFMFGGVVGR